MKKSLATLALLSLAVAAPAFAQGMLEEADGVAAAKQPAPHARAATAHAAMNHAATTHANHMSLSTERDPPMETPESLQADAIYNSRMEGTSDNP